MALLLVAVVTLAVPLDAAEDTGFRPPQPFLDGVEPEPSPADPELYPGVRRYDPPAFTHWPAVRLAGEARSAAFAVPIPARGDTAPGLDWTRGDSGELGWVGSDERVDFILPRFPPQERVSGLVALPDEVGAHTLELRLANATRHLGLRQVDACEAWPLATMRGGFPVDGDGVPVVLVDRPALAAGQRFPVGWHALPPATGTPVVVGDPLAALGADTWRDLAATTWPAIDQRHPMHACLVALAGLRRPLPAVIAWSPGNQVLHGGVWRHEEDRLLAVVRTRCQALGARPRLLLLLPPLPADPGLHDLARTRRAYLRQRAFHQGWEVLDLAAIAGDPAQANRVGPGCFTRYPCGAAQQAVRTAIAEAITRPDAMIACGLERVPTIAYPGERWHLRCAQRGPLISGAISVGRTGREPVWFDLDEDGRARAWVPTVIAAGSDELVYRLPGDEQREGLRIVAIDRGYPTVRLRDGLAVDDDGTALILMAGRPDARSRPEPVPADGAGSGRALILGDDPLAEQVAARAGDAVDLRLTVGEPSEAVIWQEWPEPAPAVLAWMPGDAPVRRGTWGATEERILGVLRARRDSRAPHMRLLLVLPDAVADPEATGLAARRRRLLRRSAFAQGWEIVDDTDPSRIEGVLNGAAWSEAVRFTALPTVVYRGEERLLTCSQAPVVQDGSATIAWAEDAAAPCRFDLHDDGRALAYLPLPTRPGRHRLELCLGGRRILTRIRCQAMEAGWPVTAIVDGVPVDAAGEAVVFVARRDDGLGARQWAVLRAGAGMPTGPAMVVGPCPDPQGVLARAGVRRGPSDTGWSCSTVVVAGLTAAGHQPPATFCWSPGNRRLLNGRWCGDEERLLDLVRARFAAIDLAPHLILLLPPLPRAAALHSRAEQRRDRLRRQAAAHGWTIIDVEDLLRRHEAAGASVRDADGMPTGAAAAELARILARRLRG